MNEANLVNRIHSIVTGDYFLREKEISLGHVRDATSFLSPFGEDGGTGSVAIVPDAVSNGISFDDGETAFLQFHVPQDYAENADKMLLRLVVQPSASAADTTDIGITTAQTIFRPGVAAITTARTAKAEAATSSSGQLVREAVLDISGSVYKAGDVVKLTLDVNNSSTTELVLVGIGLIYGSVLASYNDDDRTRV